MLRFRVLGASFSIFGCFAFDFWVLRYRDLGASLSRFGCFVFESWVLRASVFVFECFVFETTDKRHRLKEKVQKNAQFPFCGQTKAFRYEIVFRGSQPCFLHGGSERLAYFESTEAARLLKKLEVHSEVHFRIYKGFMDVFFLF